MCVKECRIYINDISCKALLQHIVIASCQVLMFMDKWTSRHMTTLQLPERLEPSTLRLRVVRSNKLRYHGSINQGKPVILVFLDLSAAFGRVDQSVCTWYVIWLQLLLSGVPQGSVLVLWFSRCIPTLLRWYAVKYHLYANEKKNSCIYHWILTMS